MTNHFYRWDSQPADEFGPCPQPGCQPSSTVMMNGQRLNCRGHLIVVARTCRYCWARFAPARPTDAHCSKTCKDRDQAYDQWIRDTPVRFDGKLGPKAPRGGASLTASTDRFALELELAS